MYYSPSYLFIKAKHILQNEGLITLLKKVFIFLVLCKLQTYFLYKFTIIERNEADFMPKIRDFTLKIISTNQQVDELVSDGFDLSSHITLIRQRVERGAIEFFIFVDGELAFIDYVAMTEKAKKSFNALPYKVDFSKEACSGGTETISKYQRNGLAKYNMYKKEEFLRERGIMTRRSAVNVKNIMAQTFCTKFDGKIYAKLRYLKVGPWESFKETPLNSDTPL
ncbi:hypothetical protein ACFLXT_00415 [Chloroflexota bacterium]